MAELDGVLCKVVAVNIDIASIQSVLRGNIDGLVSGTRGLERRAMLAAKREPPLSNAWFEAIRSSIGDLETALAGVRGNKSEAVEAAQLVSSRSQVVEQAEAQIRSNEALYEDLARLGDDSEGLRSAIAEMVRLEERLQAIVETGTGLVRRLRPIARSAIE